MKSTNPSCQHLTAVPPTKAADFVHLVAARCHCSGGINGIADQAKHTLFALSRGEP